MTPVSRSTPAAIALTERPPDPLIALAHMTRSLRSQGIVSQAGLEAWPVRPTRVTAVVAVPVRDEADFLPEMLDHLARAVARSPVPAAVVLAANNCRDDSAERVAALAEGFPCSVILLEAELVPPAAHAGWARRIALEAAACLALGDGLLLSTDADSAVPPDWIARHWQRRVAGADLVCGRIECAEPICFAPGSPGARLDRAERAYSALHDRVRHGLECRMNRADPEGPVPHYQEAGANFAVRLPLYRRLGGLVPLSSSEDRAFVESARMFGARIDYDGESLVRTSARLCGRAAGGLAQTLHDRLTATDPRADQRLMAAAAVLRHWQRLTPMDWSAWLTQDHRPADTTARDALVMRAWRDSLSRPRLTAARLEQDLPLLHRLVADQVVPALTALGRCAA